ncbi:MAG: hypothetical protein IJ258_09275 [Methanobrevibacter sp.]|uniref:hypothetical protein n=1 Tax=Methanobrevibacter sp. TaxID=66852 RepID=UPI0025E51D58|nr:hypothetical protein [Methanobrevibacter sp.]MBQ8018277.1 hypothetical protein [Methanobrevibacter sp.]
MVSRFISKGLNKSLNAQTPARLNKGQAMVRGRDAALKDREVLRRKRLELKK